MSYSLAQPIYHTFDSGVTNYTVQFYNGTEYLTIFTGKIDLITEDGTVDIDFSDLFAQYIDVFYEHIDFNVTGIQALPQVNNIKSFQNFVVSDGVNREDYNVRYNYNTDYISEIPDGERINDPIDNRIDPRQLLLSSAYNVADYAWSLNGEIQGAVAPASRAEVNLYSIRLRDIDLAPGDIVSDYYHNYRVVTECPHRYALYYVNKKGGLDSLLCYGRQVESWQSDRTQVRLYADRSNRKTFENQYIYQEIDKQYQLNTGLLSDDNARKIDNLIYSPKVFIHDLQEDTITSCVITDNSYTMKSRRNDARVFYTINVQESKPYKRR